MKGGRRLTAAVVAGVAFAGLAGTPAWAGDPAAECKDGWFCAWPLPNYTGGPGLGEEITGHCIQMTGQRSVWNDSEFMLWIYDHADCQDARWGILPHKGMPETPFPLKAAMLGSP